MQRPFELFSCFFSNVEKWRQFNYIAFSFSFRIYVRWSDIWCVRAFSRKHQPTDDYKHFESICALSNAWYFVYEIMNLIYNSKAAVVDISKRLLMKFIWFILPRERHWANLKRAKFKLNNIDRIQIWRQLIINWIVFY